MADITFYKCKKCANFVATIEEGPCTPQCCGEPMEKLVAGAVDAAVEKHVPFVTREEGRVKVQVGETAHPMLDVHYIEWVALVGDGRLEMRKLKPGDEPAVSFACEGTENVTIFAYCNLHGLWKADI